MEIRHRVVPTNGINMHIAEAGQGPVVLLAHGFPESWYSWRHQLAALSEAGFHVVAPDMRGYGRTDRPEAIEQYTLLHLVGDMVGLLDALGVGEAVIAGHDWGAPVAWHAALWRPDRFRGVVGLSVPYRPRGPGSAPPTESMPQTRDRIFYQLYFQTPGVAEAELERDVGLTLRSILSRYGAAAGKPTLGAGEVGMLARNGGFLATGAAPGALPSWIREADLAFYTQEFTRTGFRGGLNWYRNIDRNWALLAPWAGAKISVPALYVAGDCDLVLGFKGMDALLPALKRLVPRLKQTTILPDCGHWTQQEKPDAVNALMLDFLRALS